MNKIGNRKFQMWTRPPNQTQDSYIFLPLTFGILNLSHTQLLCVLLPSSKKKQDPHQVHAELQLEQRFVSTSGYTQEMWQKLFLPRPIPDFSFLTSKPFQLGQGQFSSSVAHIFLLPTGFQTIHSHSPWILCVQGRVQYFSDPTAHGKKINPTTPYAPLLISISITNEIKYKSNVKPWAVSITSGEIPLSNFT